MHELGIPKIIEKTLGKRVKQAKYAYHDAFIAWTLATLCGCTRIEQINDHKKKLEVIPNLNLPSHDTIGRIMKKLATEVKTNRSITRDRRAKFTYTHYNNNIDLNRVLIKSTKAIKALQEKISYTLDIDATYIETMRRGATKYYETENKSYGFYPLVCMIQDMPVFISMRNGSAAASFQIEDCLSECIALLEDSKIEIGRVISDAAGFNKNLMRMLDKKGIKFNIRFSYKSNMLTFNSALKNCNEWRRTEIETANYFWDCEIADITHSMFQRYSDKEHAGTYRIVVIRIPTEKTRREIETSEEFERRQIVNRKIKKLFEKGILKAKKPYEDSNWKEIDGYLHKFFITNDFDKSSEEIVSEYNSRGNAERKFSFMKKDFAWDCLPFMEMNENLVFMFAASLANNIFRGISKLFKERIPGLKLSNRLPKFKRLFIETVCLIVRNKYQFFDQDILYEELMK